MGNTESTAIGPPIMQGRQADVGCDVTVNEVHE